MHGQELGGYAYGMWQVVVFNILLFLLFVIGFIRPKKKIEWGSVEEDMLTPASCLDAP